MDASANRPIGAFLDVEGIRLHYVDRGAGPCVVLLHGNGVSLLDFEVSGLLAMAAERYRVIAFDRPGFGYSSRPDDRLWTPQAQAAIIRGALTRFGVTRPIVLGHSWGAFVALAFALEFPRDAAAIVLASGYYFPDSSLDRVAMTPPSIPMVGGILRRTIGPALGELIWPDVVRKLFAPAPVTEAFEQRYPKWMSLRPCQLRATAADAGLVGDSAAGLSPRYGELALPVVIVAGGGDQLVDTRAQSERLSRTVRRSELRIVEGAGHMVHHTAPGEVMRAIDVAAEQGGVSAERHSC